MDEETRVRLAGQLLQKIGHQLANLVGRHLHVRRRALLVFLEALLARGTPSTPLSSVSHNERLVQHAHV